MKLNRNFLTVPVLAMALVLTACGSDSDPLETDGTSGADTSGADTDGGAADGADTEGGATDGADTEGGATDGTDTEGGAIDGTDTEGGTTDGTGTDGETTDGNDTDGGTTDGTDTEGEATDGTDTEGGTDTSDSGRVVVSTVDTMFTSSVVQIIDSSDPFTSQNDLNPGVSDTIVRAFEDNYYVIRRFNSDSLAAYSVSDPSTPLYEVSTNSEMEPDVSSNPHDLVFLNSSKAYLLRYGSPIVWVVNPSVTDPALFKIGEIDLSAYDMSGGPEATRGVIVGDKLYVVMQRLQGFAPTEPGYVAVIDTATDTEINTNTGSLPGIELPAFNPGDISVDAASDTLFISAFGDFGAFDGSRPAAFTGGVVTVDTVDYSAAQLIDDNEGTGRINNVEIVSAGKGYLVSSSGFGTTSLDQFNPVTGRIEALGVAGLAGVDIRDIAVGPAGNLWVAIAAAESPKIVVINPADNSLVSDGIATTLNPTGFAFTQ